LLMFSPAAYAETSAGLNLSGREWYASPNGSRFGDGSINRPWDLATALNRIAVRPGDILWLRGGTYGKGGSTVFESKLYGNAAQPIIVRAYPGERAIIDGGLVVRGQYTWFWGFEVTNTHTLRHVAPAERPAGINIYAPGVRIINMVINNTGHPGIGFWKDAVGGEIYGTIIYGVGLYDKTTKEDNAEWMRGSAIYAQNETGERLIMDNITFRNFTTGMKAYTEGGWANGFKFLYNVVFDHPNDRSIFCAARDHPFTGLEMIGNMIYQPSDGSGRSLTVGYANVDQVDAVIKDNFIVHGQNRYGGLFVKRVANLTVSGNTIVSRAKLISFTQAEKAGQQEWNHNHYYYAGDKADGDAAPELFDIGDAVADIAAFDFATWQADTGFDAGSAFHLTLPENRIFIRPNKYEPGRAHIVVYNFQGLQSVKVDLAGILAPGTRFRIVDAQNFYGEDVVSGVFDGTPVELPLNLTAAAPIIGSPLSVPDAHTPSEFNVFVVLPILAPQAE